MDSAAAKFIAFLLASIFAAGLALADTPIEEARAKTRQATAAYNLGQYDRAAELYEQAYTLVQDPVLLYNVGQSYRLAGKPERALVAYKSFLRSAKPDAKTRRQVEERIVELEQAVAAGQPPSTNQRGQHGGVAAAPVGPASPAGPPIAPTPSSGAGEARAPAARTGWFIGGGVNVGSLRAECSTCSDDTYAAGGGEVHVGYMLRPRLGLLVDSWVMAHRQDFLTVHQAIAVVAARYWVHGPLWLQGGLGLASAGYKWDFIVQQQDRSERKPGFSVAVGYEFYTWRGIVFDAELRFGTGFYSDDIGANAVGKADSVGLGVGATWY